MSMSKGYALITGASAGIGEHLARELAARGYDLILVARRVERLDALGAELAEAHGIEAVSIASDLSEPGAGAALGAEVVARGLDVAILVNNAGLGQAGPFAQADEAQLMAMVHVNITALVELTRAVLPRLIARGKGYVLQVGSTAGFQSGPNMAVYYASKAFVNAFSDALVEELRHTNVSITTLAPGPVATEFQEVAAITETRLATTGVMSAQAVARQGVDAMFAGKALVIPGLQNRVGTLGARLLPRAVLRKLVARVNS